MRRNNFIKKAEYPGGSKALKLFIYQNLKYPKQALDNRVEGVVFLDYYVRDNGSINEINLVKAIGYGCDEEAIRLVRLLKYPAVINKDLRVNTRFKISISFKLPLQRKPISINYHYK